MMSPEQYARYTDPEGGAATLHVDLKWSLWSANEGTWSEFAPAALAHLRQMYNNHLTLHLACRKETRYGTITISGSSEAEDAPAELQATGRFEEHWDDVNELMDTLNITTTDDTYESERIRLVERLPFADYNGTPGVYREFTHHATSVAELLRLVDQEEGILIADSSSWWASLTAAEEDVEHCSECYEALENGQIGRCDNCIAHDEKEV